MLLLILSVARESPLVANRARVSLERREDGSAFVGLVPVLELVFRHEVSFPRRNATIGPAANESFCMRATSCCWSTESACELLLETTVTS